MPVNYKNPAYTAPNLYPPVEAGDILDASFYISAYRAKN